MVKNDRLLVFCIRVVIHRRFGGAYCLSRQGYRLR
jgi:hypothetical protein